MKLNGGILLLLLLFTAIWAAQLFGPYETRWDEAVYIEMGKYIFSFGHAGLWEDARPLVSPVMLGFLWKLGANPILSVGILLLFFSLGTIYVTYLIARDVFDERVAMLSSLFLAFMPTFLFFSKHAMTTIPSTFFALLSVYFFIKNKLFLSGLFMGMSFMTRFFQLLLVVPIYMILILHDRNLGSVLRKIAVNAAGFLVFVIPYLVFNLIKYGNALHPFILQLYLTQYTGWMFLQPFYYYLISLPKQNVFLAFFIFGLLFVFMKKKFNSHAFLLAIVSLAFLLAFSIAPHKEMRIALMFLPYVSILASFGIVRLFQKIRHRKVVYLLIIAVFAVQAIFQYQAEHINVQVVPFQEYIAENPIGDGLWISNPIYIVSSDQKADELIYYSTTNAERISELMNQLPDARHILINTCDIPCQPWDDACPSELESFIGRLKERFTLVYYDTFFDCRHYIFSG